MKLLLLLLLLAPSLLGLQQQFLSEPSSLTVTAGQRVVLPCSVQHKEGLLQWTKDGFGLGVGRELPGYPSYSMAGQDPVRDYTLVLEEVGLAEDATYQCQVGAGELSVAIRSSPAVLTVLVPPGQPRLTKGSGVEGGRTTLEVEAEEGEEVVVTCVSEGGRPAAELTWRDELGDLVMADTDTSTHNMGDKSWKTVSVIRMRLGFEDRGRSLVCEASSHLSPSPLEAVARLVLSYGPRVVLQPGGEGREGGDMTVHCGVHAFPPPSSLAW